VCVVNYPYGYRIFFPTGVVLYGHMSSWAQVVGGIPQGFIPGPLFFVLYVNAGVHRTLWTRIQLSIGFDALLVNDIPDLIETNICQNIHIYASKSTAASVYEKYSTRGRVVNTARGEAECCIYHKTLPSAVFHTHKCFKWYIVLDHSQLMYMPNQAHNCTVWLIQYSYAVDYYFMNYTAHFFALILPLQYIYILYYKCLLIIFSKLNTD